MYVESKTIENKEKRTCIRLGLNQLFDLSKFDLVRVDCNIFFSPVFHHGIIEFIKHVP